MHDKWNALCDLVSFVQLKKKWKIPIEEYILKYHSSMGVFYVFNYTKGTKLYKISHIPISHLWKLFTEWLSLLFQIRAELSQIGSALIITKRDNYYK